MSSFRDDTGRQYGLLFVKRFVGMVNKLPIYEVECECGTVKQMNIKPVRDGSTRSCGCIRRRKGPESHNFKHGLTGTRIYRIWQGMRERCYKKYMDSYQYYGAKGITVCDSWNNSFLNFYEDMKDGYADHLTIGRIDHDKGYSKDNCTWSTVTEQNNDRTGYCRYVKYRGETKTISQWARHLGLGVGCLWQRLESGWSVEKSFTTPVQKTGFENENVTAMNLVSGTVYAGKDGDLRLLLGISTTGEYLSRKMQKEMHTVRYRVLTPSHRRAVGEEYNSTAQAFAAWAKNRIDDHPYSTIQEELYNV